MSPRRRGDLPARTAHVAAHACAAETLAAFAAFAEYLALHGTWHRSSEHPHLAALQEQTPTPAHVERMEDPYKAARTSYERQHGLKPGIAVGPIDRETHTAEQLDTSTTRQFGGTDLGLTIGHHVVEVLVGTTGVDNELNHGNTLWLTVPPRVSDALSEDTEQNSLDGLRVLLVDRSADARADALTETMNGMPVDKPIDTTPQAPLEQRDVLLAVPIIAFTASALPPTTGPAASLRAWATTTPNR